MRQSGSSLLTLGFAVANTEDLTIIAFVAAATGPIVIGMLIGFLPTIYSVYIEREVDVTMLGTTAGEPVWGPELLARHALAGDIEGLLRSIRRVVTLGGPPAHDPRHVPGPRLGALGPLDRATTSCRCSR